MPTTCLPWARDCAMDLLEILLLLLGITVALGAIARFVVRGVGLPCQFCENRKVSRFDELAESQRRALLRYFRLHEAREPDASGIFACLNCMTVHDDFSGEKRSMDVDTAGFGGVLARSYCKVCNNLIQGCDPANDDIRCSHCGTPYRWQVHEDSGFRFLMPPREASILERCRDVGGLA